MTAWMQRWREADEQEDFWVGVLEPVCDDLELVNALLETPDGSQLSVRGLEVRRCNPFGWHA